MLLSFVLDIFCLSLQIHSTFLHPAICPRRLTCIDCVIGALTCDFIAMTYESK